MYRGRMKNTSIASGFHYNQSMTKSRIFFAVALSFIAGVGIGSFVQAYAKPLAMLPIVLSVALASVFYRDRKVLIVAFCLLALGSGSLRQQAVIEKIIRLPDEVKFSGTVRVSREPARKDRFQTVVFSAEQFGQAQMSAGNFEDIRYGNVLDLECLLKRPENRDTEFDYRMYLAKEKIYYVCDRPEWKKAGSGRGNRIFAILLGIRQKLQREIAELLPYPESGLGSGILFGGSNLLPKEVSDKFSGSGLTHVMAVSGYNVTIIAEYLVLGGIFLGLWRRQALYLALFGILIFVAMIGWPASAVRAGIMGSLLIWAMQNGRLAHSLNAILLAGAVMLAANPLILRYDVGFQLSFLATLGIVLLSPLFENIFIKKHKWLGFMEIIFLTVSAQIFVVPVLLYNFHNFSWISILANFLALPAIPIAMLLSFLAALLGLISDFLAAPFAWLATLMLKYVISIAGFFAAQGWAKVESENFPAWSAVLWYGGLLAIIWWIRKRDRYVAEK